jgi:hypothetical protein
LSRHPNYKGQRKPTPLSARERTEQAALDELLRHGGNADDVRNLERHFSEVAEPPEPEEIPKS